MRDGAGTSLIRARCSCRSRICAATSATTARSRAARDAVEKAYLTPDDVLAIARAGARAGCKEVLFTLGDQPEARYPQARAALASLGHESTLSYLREVAQRVLDDTGLLPHLNPGLMGAADLAVLRKVAPSMGIMLETASDRLSEQGGPHFGSPDKLPARRLETIRLAGEMRVPLTTGILIGIGETRRERIDALLALRDLADRHGHIQEIIVQNFRAKPGTKMHSASQPSMDDLCWTIAVARLIFGPDMSIQAPPNLYSGDLTEPIASGDQRLGRGVARHARSRQPGSAVAASRSLDRGDRACRPHAGRTSHRVSALHRRARGMDRPGDCIATSCG